MTTEQQKSTAKVCLSHTTIDITLQRKKIDECAPYIDEVLSEAPYSAVRVKELVEKRFNTKIGYTTVQKYVKQIKKNYNHQVTVRFETMPGLQG